MCQHGKSIKHLHQPFRDFSGKIKGLYELSCECGITLAIRRTAHVHFFSKLAMLPKQFTPKSATLSRAGSDISFTVHARISDPDECSNLRCRIYQFSVLIKKQCSLVFMLPGLHALVPCP